MNNVYKPVDMLFSTTNSPVGTVDDNVSIKQPVRSAREKVMTPEAAIRAEMDRDVLRHLSRPAPVRLVAQTVFEWLMIVAAAALAWHVGSILLNVLCLFFIATRQHALLALMHEYAHHQVSRRFGVFNDLLGDIFTAFPFFITVHGFRRNHMPHHRHTSSADDPNWMSSLRKERYHFPKTKAQIWLEMFKHCIGWYTLDDLKGYTVDAGMALDLPLATRVSRAVFVLVLAAGLTWAGLWIPFLLYWILPLSTFLMAILYLRDMGEHFGMSAPGIAGSRTVIAGFTDRALISPNAVNFHAEHHLFPAVPFFRLHQLHDAMKSGAAYQQHAVITHGYFTGLIDEVSRCKSVVPPAVADNIVPSLS